MYFWTRRLAKKSIFEFWRGTGNLAAAIQVASDKLGVNGGGVLYFPNYEGGYVLDDSMVSTQYFIHKQHDGVHYEGESQHGVIIENNSATGKDLFAYETAENNSIQRGGYHNLGFLSQNDAGHIWTFLSKGLSFYRFEDLYVRQQNGAKKIMTTETLPGGEWVAPGGMFENQFTGGVYEHGTTNDPATVPAFDLVSANNLITLNKWMYIRTHCRASEAPFFRIVCTGADTGPHNHQNEWRGINVEVAKRGWLYVSGAIGTVVEDVEFYDIHTEPPGLVDGYLFEIETGPGGKPSWQTFFRNVRRSSGDLGGVAAVTPVAVTATQTGGVATYNSGATPHGLTTGMAAYVTGFNETNYNGHKPGITRINNFQYTFPIDSGTASPATGSGTSQPGALDVKIGSGALQEIVFDTCASGSGGNTMVVDLNNNYAVMLGHREDKTLFLREDTLRSATLAVGGGGGLVSEARVDTVKTDNISARTVGGTIALNDPFDVVTATTVDASTVEADLLQATEIEAIVANDPVLVRDGLYSPSPADWAVTIPTDGPIDVAVPETETQWLKLGLHFDSWWLAQSLSGDDPDEGVNGFDLSIDATVDRQQTISGWTGFTMHFAEVAGESANIGSGNYDPSLDAACGLFYAKINTVGATRTAMALGIMSAGAASGKQLLRFLAAGTARIETDGGNVDGTYVYEGDGLFHPFLLCYSKKRQRIKLITDREVIEGIHSTNIVDGTKGFGANGSLTPPDMDVRFMGWAYGARAEKIFDQGERVIGGLRWSLAAPSTVPTGPAEGLKLSRAAARQISIGIGSCRSLDDTYTMTLDKAEVVDLDVAGIGGLDTGTVANTTNYSIWLLGDSTGVLRDRGIATTSALTPLMPAGYDKRRFLGWVLTDGSANLLHWTMHGNGKTRVVHYDEARSVLLVLNAQGNIAFTDLDLTPLVPTGVSRVLIQTALVAPTGTAAVSDVLEIRPNGAFATDGLLFGAAQVLDQPGYHTAWVTCDSGQVIEWKTTDADDDASIWVRAYELEI